MSVEDRLVATKSDTTESHYQIELIIWTLHISRGISQVIGNVVEKVVHHNGIHAGRADIQF
jgi:hypothetical protein